jgi:hypothetical protein
MTKPGLQHEKPRTGRKKIKEMEPCHDIKKKRQEITGNATRKPLRPLMTSCKSRPAMVYEAKKKGKLTCQWKWKWEYMSHGVLEVKQAV